jgi:HK97 family phage major capsid protein/HK97 family phage prohead protease
VSDHLQRAYGLLEIKAVEDDGEQRILTGIASTISPDRMNDVVVPEGAKFTLPLPLLHQHDSRMPIGEVYEAAVNGKRITVKARIAKDSGLDYVEDAWKQIKAKLVKGFSIGFRSLKHEPLDPQKPWDGFKFLEWEWMELSTVTLPANAQATITAVKSAAGRPVAVSPGEASRVTPGSVAGSVRKASTQIPPGVTSMKTSDRIDALSREVVQIKDGVSAILNACEAEGREPNEAEAAEIAVAEEQIATKQKALDTYKAAERSLASKAAANAPAVIGQRSKSRDAGDFLVKSAVSRLVSHVKQRPVTEVAEALYSRDAEALEVVKSVVDPAKTNVQGWAADLVRDDVQGFMDLLRAVSIYPQLASRGVSLNFNGAHSVKIPGRTATPTLAGAFTAEAGLIPVKKLGFTSQTLNAYKMAVISTFSREIVEQSTPNIETIVRKAMVDDTGEAIDAALLGSGAAVVGVRPAGIQVGATTAAQTGTGTLADILTDIRTMTQALATGRGGRSPVWIMHPARVQGLSFVQTVAGGFMFADELRAGRFLNVPVLTSINVPSSVVFLVDAADFASAFDAPMFMASDQATIIEINEDNTDPSIDAASGGIEEISNVTEAVTATTKGPVRSLYQTDTLALRMIMPLSWAVLRPALTQVRTAVTW